MHQVMDNFYILSHVRNAEITRNPWYQEKSIVRTRTAWHVFNHYPWACLASADYTCRPNFVDQSLAIMAHYRRECRTENFSDEECLIMANNATDILWALNYKDELVERVQKTLRKLEIH